MALHLASRMAKKPYYIEEIKTDVYSLEEINYFIFNHINLVYREFFKDELFDYIDNEIGRKDIADGLRKLSENKAELRDFVRFILTESGYYSASELSVVAAYVMNIDVMSDVERRKIEADGYYKIGKADSALRIYLGILKEADKKQMSEAFFAKVAYSIGVIYAGLFMSKNANAFFTRAFELYPDPVYARACLYMSLVNNDEEELLDTIRRYGISDETLESERNKVASLRREIETDEETVNFIYDFENGLNSENIIEGWKEDYYERIS